ncbi:MAG: LCP family protein [Oscillospiraceae bacterium]|nr:LCP family protein [Oscillospiraceae bacterium]
MKFTGNARKGQHVFKNAGNESSAAAAKQNIDNGNKKPKTGIPVKRIIKIVSLSVAILAVLAATVLALDLFAETDIVIRPPTIQRQPRQTPSAEPDDPDNPEQPSSVPAVNAAVQDVGDDRVFTFLVFGMDEGYNADVIMAVTFDTSNQTLEVVSIPRDTLVNVPWNLKLANSIPSNMRHRYRAITNRDEREALAMQASVEMFADILGFEVDFWVSVNMRAFTTLIDAVGGIDFYVPVNMRYTDRAANLNINFSRGMHHGLTGQQALEILRFRSFATGDIARINVQQQFLTAAVEQILENRASLGTPANILRLAEIAINQVRTNISLSNMAWLGREFMQLNPEHVRFATIPHTMNDAIAGRGYIVINLDEWMEMLNERINPFSNDKVPEDLSILTRGPDRRLMVTDDNWTFDRSWGAASRGPATPQGGGNALNVVGGGGGAGARGTPGGGGTQGATPPPPPAQGNAEPPPVAQTPQESHEPDEDEYDPEVTDAPPDTIPGEPGGQTDVTGDDSESAEPPDTTDGAGQPEPGDTPDPPDYAAPPINPSEAHVTPDRSENDFELNPEQPAQPQNEPVSNPPDTVDTDTVNS